MVLFTGKKMSYSSLTNLNLICSRRRNRRRQRKKHRKKNPNQKLQQPRTRKLIKIPRRTKKKKQHWRRTRMNYVKRSKVNESKEQCQQEIHKAVILDLWVQFPAFNEKIIIYVSDQGFYRCFQQKGNSVVFTVRDNF